MDKVKVFISFKDVLDYFDYIKKHPEKVLDEYLTVATVHAELTPKEVDELALDERIEYVQIDKDRRPVPDSTFTYANGEVSAGQMDVPGVRLRHQEGWTGKGVKIAVIDTGFENAIGPNGQVDVEYAQIIHYESDSIGSHGVEMGSIMGSKANGSGLVGSAPDATLYGLGVNAVDSKTGKTYMSTRAIYKGLDWAIKNKVDIVSMSFSSAGYDSTEHNLIKQLANNNIIPVAAASNNANGDGTNFKPYETERYPSGYDEVISVAGAYYSEERKMFLNQYNYRDSTTLSMAIPRSAYLPREGKANSPITDSGIAGIWLATSGCTAYTSGIIATIRQQFPGISKDEVVELLLEDSQPVRNGLGRVPRLTCLDQGAFAVRRNNSWSKMNENKFKDQGFYYPSNHFGNSALGMMQSAVRWSTIEAQNGSRGAYLFRYWPFEDFPKITDDKYTATDFMFADITHGGTVDLSMYKFANSKDARFMFRGVKVDSLDISSFGDNIMNDMSIFNSATIRTIFVANNSIAKKIADGYYTNFDQTQMDYIVVGKAGTNASKIYKSYKAGHFSMRHLSGGSNANIVENGGKYWFSGTGAISFPLNGKALDFGSKDESINRIKVMAELPGRKGTITIKVFPASGSGKMWQLDSPVSSNLVSNSQTTPWVAYRIDFEADDGGTINVIVDERLNANPDAT